MNACLEVSRSVPARAGGFCGTEPTTTDSRLSLALFDEIAIGLIVCDAQGFIRFANHAARHELAGGRLLARAGDKLCRSPGASGELDVALRLAAQRGRRGLVLLSARGDRLMASVLPLRLEGEPEQQVLVVLGRRSACDELGLEMLATSYRLTLGERRVLAALLQETTPRQIAANHAVALSTVRTQISSLRAKMGARTIEALLLRAAVVPPVAGALRALVDEKPPGLRFSGVGLLAA